jgi:hypothetical protein
VKNERDVRCRWLSTALVALYLTLAHLLLHPAAGRWTVPADRVAAASLEVALPGIGAALLAVGIMISTFGCANGMLLSGARAYYAMARDGLFFGGAGRLNAQGVPARGLVIQGLPDKEGTLGTQTGKIEFESTSLLRFDPNDRERPPVPTMHTLRSSG